jgi:hypothetical protein
MEVSDIDKYIGLLQHMNITHVIIIECIRKSIHTRMGKIIFCKLTERSSFLKKFILASRLPGLHHKTFHRLKKASVFNTVSQWSNIWAKLGAT